MKNKCEICGNNCEGERCFRHKLKKPLSQKRGFSSSEKKEETEYKFKEFFISIWEKRPHICISCDVYLGNEPRTFHFDHILEKEKYPELEFKEENIELLCLHCHDNKTRGHYSEKIKKNIERVKQLFGK